jgi:hypothetical protein
MIPITSDAFGLCKEAPRRLSGGSLARGTYVTKSAMS